MLPSDWSSLVLVSSEFVLMLHDIHYYSKVVSLVTCSHRIYLQSSGELTILSFFVFGVCVCVASSD